MANAGEVLNRGFEIELGWKDKIGDFNYSINANMATLHNELTYLDPTVDKLPGTSLQGSSITTECVVGQPLWHFLGFKIDGLDEEGYPIFSDLNGDGKFEPNESDMTDLGCGLPKLNYGVLIHKFPSRSLSIDEIELLGNPLAIVYLSKSCVRGSKQNKPLAVPIHIRWSSSS